MLRDNFVYFWFVFILIGFSQFAYFEWFHVLNVSRITLIRVIVQTVKRDLYFCTFKTVVGWTNQIVTRQLTHVPKCTPALMHTFLGSICIAFSKVKKSSLKSFPHTNLSSFVFVTLHILNWFNYFSGQIVNNFL